MRLYLYGKSQELWRLPIAGTSLYLQVLPTIFTTVSGSESNEAGSKLIWGVLGKLEPPVVLDCRQSYHSPMRWKSTKVTAGAYPTVPPRFDQRARAAFWAFALRCAAVSFWAEAFPPFLPSLRR